MEYNLFMGGQSGNTSNRMVPSGTPEGITGYADHQRSRDSAPSRSSHGVRKPGFCAPWPGESTASTYSTLRDAARSRRCLT